MNRRNFLTRLGLIAGGIALEQAIPFNRVWSFPKEIVIPKTSIVGLEMIAGLDWAFDSSDFSIRTIWRRDKSTGAILKRTERLHRQCVEVLSDWQETPYTRLPFIPAPRPAFHP